MQQLFGSYETILLHIAFTVLANRARTKQHASRKRSNKNRYVNGIRARRRITSQADGLDHRSCGSRFDLYISRYAIGNRFH